MKTLHPTLWRTCRALANAGRLRCLRLILEHPGSSVGEIARRAQVAVPVASASLRALQARGLVRASRDGRWVRYTPDPDPQVAGASRLLAALRRSLLVDRLPEEELIRQLTAFTHPRRIAVVKLLRRAGAVLPERLSARARMSQPALSRHLAKLSRRGVIERAEGERWTMGRSPARLLKTLIALIDLGSV